MKYRCKFCDFRTVRKKRMDSHMKTHDPNETVGGKYLIGRKIPPLSELKNFSYKLCGIKFYWINLDRSVSRKKEMENIFTQLDIPNERISGYDGKILESYRDFIFKSDITVYEKGCTMSHLKAIKTAYDAGEKIAFISEDDIRFDHIDKWEMMFSNIVANSPVDWEIIKLHCNNTKHIANMINNKNTSMYQKWSINSFSTGAYIINRHGMEKILKVFYENNENKWMIKKENAVADNLLYSTLVTYDYAAPTFTHQVNESIIHPDHLRLHLEALKVIDNYYDELPQTIVPFPVYWINLGRCEERKSLMMKEFKKYNICHKRIEGYDGKVLDSYNELGKNTDNVSDYEFACCCSHLNAIKHSYTDGNKMVMISEDDIRFNYSPLWEKKLYDIVNNAPDDWEILKFQCGHVKHIKKLKKRYFSKGILYSKWELRSVGCGFYLINSRGMKKIIKMYQNGKWIITSDRPISDKLVYKTCITYDYTVPMIDFAVNDSTIHEEHLDSHSLALKEIKKHYQRIKK